jgi:hypothetical protein
MAKRKRTKEQITIYISPQRWWRTYDKDKSRDPLSQHRPNIFGIGTYY